MVLNTLHRVKVDLIENKLLRKYYKPSSFSKHCGR